MQKIFCRFTGRERKRERERERERERNLMLLKISLYRIKILSKSALSAEI
jgi:hypothetical protein